LYLSRYIFLRWYGLNLERRSRNSPEQACNEAIIQCTTFMTVPCSVALAVPLAYFYPESVQPPRDGLHFMVVGLAIVLYLATRSFRSYARTPQAADRFRSVSSRRVTMVAFFVVPILSVGLLVLALHLLGTRH
jgi:hypothetical protein